MTGEIFKVRDFYVGRSVFITGASGFIGKVLVEKLLRSFPEIENVYVLIRPKKGKTVEQRINDIVNIPLFEKLRQSQPDVIRKKLKPIAGDVIELGLGLSDADRELITENVSIIIHGAASVRFDDPLKRAILLNTRGTREMCKLALETKNLLAFLHISTTYCQLDKPVVEERAYPPLADWEKTIEIAENVDDYTMDILADKYMHGLPNTYTFAKSLAERVVYDMCKDKIPTIIYRPSIIISTFEDPIPGWVDNFNGPVALLVASGKGILRISYADPNIRCDYVPVDIAVRAIILAAWRKGITRNGEDHLDITFYNASNNNMHSITTGEMVELGMKFIFEAPLKNVLWFPAGKITNSRTYYYINMILFQVLPAIIIDKLLVLMDKKPMLLKIQRRIYIANMALQIFLTNQWSFLNDNAVGLITNVVPEEQQEYGFDPMGIDVFNYFRTCVIYGRQFLLNEDDTQIESKRANLYRMYVLDKTVKFLFYIFMIWILVSKVGVLDYAGRVGNKVFETFTTWE